MNQDERMELYLRYLRGKGELPPGAEQEISLESMEKWYALYGSRTDIPGALEEFREGANEILQGGQQNSNLNLASKESPCQRKKTD